ncbi:ATP-dependent helicase HrpB [Streptomyces nodosus]|uniref:ATP-dependent helicase n=1 Tax=Streptomyces nodosus TaxID=40318 RepID=A0A0B5DIF6_9ACTN|nr:ATP-dependent helicase HrpB [Streptomyces nodosus]AJE40206.1 ATP-dependent helicase [Streptomyces nodosus]MBB4791224.1 ATP-dependent helicase HrpB [Streptomyces nodosus]QEV38786.1 ATP-dependent helicase HrpB [Streptomyces nodosus]
MIRHDALDRLPVRSALPALRDALDAHGVAVLCAPPGTGKTTLVPLVLAGLVGGGPARRVVVAEPRRIAARAAARRMAWLLGERPGESVGHTVRGERVRGPRTRVEVVTTGVLLQRLQRDQELAGVDVVVLDECHERHLDADTAAAFLLDVRAALRPELRLVAASATTDAEGWARLLGGAPVVEAEGVSHPVEVVWAPPPGPRAGGAPTRPVRPPHGMRVDPALLSHVASVVRRALAECAGDVLCFLPGVGEIARVAAQLRDLGGGVEVLQVHGRAPAAVQDAVLSAGTGRRVVLATAVAESSLTVPGVRAVVDSGLAREPRVDHARGLSALTTVRASQATGRQRAGRAGREAPGRVYRCWSEAEDGRLPRFPAPEIKLADLTAFALGTACWGDPDASGLALLDAPPAGAMAAARSVLTAIDAVDTAGRATERGTRMSRLGLHPRLARALLDAAPEIGVDRAAEVVALLSEEPPREYGDDLSAAWRTARRGGDAYAARWREETRRLRAAAGEAGSAGADRAAGAQDDQVVGLVAALAFPERLARSDGGSFLMVNGTRAEPADGSRLRGAPWLAVAVADRPVGSVHARVRLAAVVDEDVARRASAALHTVREEVHWADGEVVAREVERLGAVELTVRPLREPAPAPVREALLEGLREDGLELLRWSPDARLLRRRLAFLRLHLGEPWPDVSDEALHARPDDWLEPELSRARRRADLARIDAGEALARLLPWSTGDAARLDELAPERITVPSGSRIRIDYEDPERPVLAVKLQELFGLQRSPTVAGVPLLVHLLSPAGRPAAVTADLASFWRDGYRAVRAELRGRYPKHPWPEDPAGAEPTRHTNARLRR